MKNIRFIRAAVVVALLFISFAATAREWHVNNKQGIPAHFSDINAAMASADVVDGDTLYIGNGAVLEDAQTINKAVTVIGTGWGYNDSQIVPAKMKGDITISSVNAKIIGLYITGIVYANADGIVIERCHIVNGIYNSVASSRVHIRNCYTGTIDSNASNNWWEIRNNIIESSKSNNTGIMDRLYNAVIENNIIRNISGAGYGSWSKHRILFDGCNYCTIKNNVIYCGNDNYAITDVDINYYFHECNNTIVQNNVMSLQSSAENRFPGNICTNSCDRKLIFKCSGSVESGEYYSLKEGSPAIGAGENGIDCGVMAGVYKFAPFGRPRNIPVLKKASVPVMPTDGKVKVSFKIENNNE